MDPVRGRSAPITRPRLLLLGAVAAIALGVLGMHVLPMGAGSLGPAAASVPRTTADMARSMPAHPQTDSSTALLGGDARTAQEESTVAPPAQHGGHGVSDMLMLCTAMLLAAAVVLLVARALGRYRARDHAHRPPASLSIPVPLRVATGPPPVWRFSVIRC